MRFVGWLAVFLVFSTTSKAGFDEAAAYSARVGGVSMAVVSQGEIVFEDYPNGGGAGEAHELASGTKSFSAVIAAAAVQDGLLTLDERAADTLAEWRDDRGKAGITIRQILWLTSGVKTPPPGRIPTYADAVALPLATDPGAAFEYGPANFQIFGEIMRRKLAAFEGGVYPDAVAYLQARVFNVIGIRPASWNRDGGLPRLPMGADMTARDWARFGAFVLAGGRWNGEAIIDEVTLKATFEGSRANPAYGLAWWLAADPGQEVVAASRTMRRATDLYTNADRDGLPGDLVMAAGAGGQRLYIIPSRGLVVVRQHPNLIERRRGRRGGGFSDVEFLKLLLE